MILGVSNNLLKEGNRIDTFEAGGDAVDGEGVAAEVGEIETDGCEAGKNLLKEICNPLLYSLRTILPPQVIIILNSQLSILNSKLSILNSIPLLSTTNTRAVTS